MNHYRLYFLTNFGGRIERFEPIQAYGDEAAIEAAKLYRGSYPLELWQRGRMVEAFARSVASLAPSLPEGLRAVPPLFRGGR